MNAGTSNENGACIDESLVGRDNCLKPEKSIIERKFKLCAKIQVHLQDKHVGPKKFATCELHSQQKLPMKQNKIFLSDVVLLD